MRFRGSGLGERGLGAQGVWVGSPSRVTGRAGNTWLICGVWRMEKEKGLGQDEERGVGRRWKCGIRVREVEMNMLGSGRSES